MKRYVGLAICVLIGLGLVQISDRDNVFGQVTQQPAATQPNQQATQPLAPQQLPQSVQQASAQQAVPQQLPTQPVPGKATPELISHSFPMNDRVQCITVIDPRTKQLCVYHVELSSGKITFLSARSIAYDLQLNDWNSEKPLPREIKSIVEQRGK